MRPKDCSMEPAKMYDEYALDIDELTAEQLQFIRDLNQKLIEIEKSVLSEALPQLQILKERLKDPDDWLTDIEVEARIQYFLSESDPLYDDDRDNVLYEQIRNLKGILGEYDFYQQRFDEDYWGMNDGNNHNLFETSRTHPFKGEYHCWLFHCLYDHSHIGWVNILRIDGIWADIVYYYQRDFGELPRPWINGGCSSFKMGGVK